MALPKEPRLPFTLGGQRRWEPQIRTFIIYLVSWSLWLGVGLWSRQRKWAAEIGFSKIVIRPYDLNKSRRFLETISLLENLGQRIKRKRDKCRLGDSKYGLNIFYINMKNRVTLMNKVESKLEALKKLSSQLVTITQTKTSRTTHRHTQERKHNQASHSPLFWSLMRRIHTNTEVWSIKPTRPSLTVQSSLSPCPLGKPRF